MDRQEERDLATLAVCCASAEAPTPARSRVAVAGQVDLRLLQVAKLAQEGHDHAGVPSRRTRCRQPPLVLVLAPVDGDTICDR